MQSNLFRLELFQNLCNFITVLSLINDVRNIETSTNVLKFNFSC